MSKYNNIIIQDCKDYISQLLSSLSNWCSKCPLSPTVQYNKDTKELTTVSGDKSITILIDPKVEKKKAIQKIADYFFQFYPIIEDTKIIFPNTEQMEKQLDNGKKLVTILSNYTIQKYPKYTVLRKHDKYNELDVIEIKTGLIYKLKTTIPVTIFLQKLNDTNFTPLEHITILYQIVEKGGKK